ncbi:Wzz/FepE/Etk N-terminal domain-containing protein [Pseudoalteromonas sp. GB56]
MKTSTEITFADVLAFLVRYKITILIASMAGVAISIVIALHTPNKYTSSVVVIPSEESQGGGIAALAGQFGGLASMAGIDLNSSGQTKLTMAMESLLSRSFLSGVIEKHNWKPLIMAVDSWDYERDLITYDITIYDDQAKKWVRDVQPPLQIEPSLQEVYETFVRDNFSVGKNSENGVVTITVKHFSPYVARMMAETLLFEINEFIRKSEVEEATRSISFLKEKINDVALKQMRSVFYSLIEQQMQTVMLAEVRKEYFFKTLDPAIAPELPSTPNRPLIVVLGAFLGGILGVFISLLRLIVKLNRNRTRAE